MGCSGSKETKKLAKIKRMETANKSLVSRFFDQVIIPKCVDPLDKFVNPLNHTEHDPYITDGFNQLKTWLTNWFASGDELYYGVEHLAADGDLVWVHSKCMMAGKNAAAVDIFRVRDGLIIEHWDVTQFVPTDSTSKHPMF